MAVEKSSLQTDSTSSATLGAMYCALAAISYTAANVCMRYVSKEVAPSWAVCNKELVTVLVTGLWILLRIRKGLPVIPSRIHFITLVLVGLAVQLIGNQGTQWAFGVVGLAVTIPVMIGAMLVGSAIFGHALLGERVSSRSVVAIAFLVLSLVLLGMGAENAGQFMSASQGYEISPFYVLLAVLAATTAGIVFALFSIAIRWTMTNSTPHCTLLFIITGIGVVTLGPLSLFQLGWETLLNTPINSLFWIYAAGIFNLIGFLGLTKGLQLTTVVHANMLNASQVALASICGILFFSEPLSLWLIGGIVVTILGILLVDQPGMTSETVDHSI